jgi:hypothetical protein
VLGLRFARLPVDEPGPDNPLYHATIWLIDALRDASVLADLDARICAAQRAGLVPPSPADGATTLI